MNYIKLFTIFIFIISIISCSKQETSEKSSGGESTKESGQSNVVDDVSQKNIVKVAIGSPDHTTLVAAVQAASLVDVLSNAGPFTVFAPTNAAFEKLPKGTVEELLKPENKNKLASILQHHVTTSARGESLLRDGETISMADGKNVKITKKDGATFINDAKILGSVVASNGIVHVVDCVVLP
ncbi:MAG: fasciclin domain-containing protein [Bacteroidota bacterium]